MKTTENIVCVFLFHFFLKHPVMQERFYFNSTQKGKKKYREKNVGENFLTNSNNIGK